MSNLVKHALNEFRILEQTVEDPIILPFKAEILALVERFAQSGQSGGSAPYTAGSICAALKTLLAFEPICPILGTEEEWANTWDNVWQNQRCSSLFKEGAEGKPYYLDAIVWRTPTGATWSGTAYLPDGRAVTSRQYVQEFPFKPKTFIIDVAEQEVAPDDWEFRIETPEQLEAVFEYYDFFTRKQDQ